MKPERIQQLPPSLATWTLDSDTLVRRWNLPSPAAAAALARYLDTVFDRGEVSGRLGGVALEIRLGGADGAATPDLVIAEEIEGLDHEGILAEVEEPPAPAVEVLGYPSRSGGG